MTSLHEHQWHFIKENLSWKGGEHDLTSDDSYTHTVKFACPCGTVIEEVAKVKRFNDLPS